MEWARPILDVVFDGVSDAVDYQLQHTLEADRYWRLQVELQDANDDLDDASEDNLAKLRAHAEALIAESSPQTRRGDRRAHLAQGPVSTGPSACASASATTESGTPKPLRPLSETVAAKIVVTTRPPPSTIGPPELPGRTRPRNEVIERRTGPRP